MSSFAFNHKKFVNLNVNSNSSLSINDSTNRLSDDALKVDVLEMKNKFLKIDDRLENIVNNVIPKAIEQIVKYHIDEIRNERDLTDYYILEKEAKTSKSYSSSAILNILNKRVRLILGNNVINEKFNDLRLLRYICIYLFLLLIVYYYCQGLKLINNFKRAETCTLTIKEFHVKQMNSSV
jgi:hypothetical protein